jgi:hypothetical protein
LAVKMLAYEIERAPLVVEPHGAARKFDSNRETRASFYPILRCGGSQCSTTIDARTTQMLPTSLQIFVVTCVLLA